MARIKDKKITILHAIREPDGQGGFSATWVPLPGGENIWAYYRQASGKEVFEAFTVNVIVEAVFEINYRKDIDASMKVLFREEEYAITRIDDFEGYKNGLRIYAYRKEF